MFKSGVTIVVLLLAVCPASAGNEATSSSSITQLPIETRTLHLQWLKQHLIENYPALHCKEKLGIVNTSEVFKQAIQQEAGANPGLNAFYNRTRKLIAHFQDTHLKVFPETRFPTIRIPLQLVDTASGVYVLNSSPVSNIQNGDRVISFNAIAIEQMVTQLSALTPGSSGLYVRRRALERLVRRSFSYPDSAQATITLERSDGSTYSRELRYTEVFNNKANPKIRTSLNTRGILPPKPPASSMTNNQATDWGALKDSREYRDSNGLIIKFGIKKFNNRSAGVLQIFGFPDGSIQDSSGDSTSFKEAVLRIIQTLQARRLPLILDLRRNSGGNGERSFELMRILTPPNTEYASTTRSLLLNQRSRALINSAQGTLIRIAAWMMGGIPEIDGYRTLHQHLESNPLPDGKLTPLFAEAGTLRTDPKSKGYQQKVIALIGPECVSTCDMLANMLAFNKRATLVGEPTNGTGGGMVGTGSVPWQPSLSPDKLFYYEVPNKVVGKPLGIQEELFPAENICANALAENMPANPAITYVPEIENIFNQQRRLVKILGPLLQ